MTGTKLIIKWDGADNTTAQQLLFQRTATLHESCSVVQNFSFKIQVGKPHQPKSEYISVVTTTWQLTGCMQTSHSSIGGWKLERTIVIHDIYDFHQISLTRSGQQPWSADGNASTTTSIHIAYRRYQTFSLYNAAYRSLGKLEGHYWAIIPLPQQSVPALPTHNFFQPLDSIADHPMMGNGR